MLRIFSQQPVDPTGIIIAIIAIVVVVIIFFAVYGDRYKFVRQITIFVIYLF